MAMILSKLIASAFLLSLCLIVTQTGATDVKYCTKRDYNVKVSGVEISPNPVARGAPATFTISATTGEAISGGKVEIEVSYFGLHVHSETHDLCEESSCPVAEGDFILSHTQVLPGYTPPVSEFSFPLRYFYFRVMQQDKQKTFKKLNRAHETSLHMSTKSLPTYIVYFYLKCVTVIYHQNS